MRFNRLEEMLAAGCLAIAVVAIAGGCKKERIVDVKTPIGNVQVDKDKTTGDVDVGVTREKPATP